MNVLENVQSSLLCSEERRRNGTREETKDAILSVPRVEPVLGGRSCREDAAVVPVELDVTLLWMKCRSILSDIADHGSWGNKKWKGHQQTGAKLHF